MPSNEEFRERGKIKKIEFAATTQVIRRAENLDKIVRLMGEVADADWKLSNCFVSDLSSVGDFLHDDEEAVSLSQKLGFTVERSELLVEVAMRTEPKN